MYKIASYLRVSTEEAAQLVEGSIQSQRHRLQSFVDLKNAQEENWGKVVEIYSDEGISAKDMNRPAFQRMMQDIRKGKINLILVTELSRLSRSIKDFCEILEELKTHKAGFLSIKEQFDTSTSIGEMMVFNMINLAQFERRQTSERISLNFHARAMRGLLNGGQAPLGYDKDPAKKCTYSVNQLEAPQVKKVFQNYVNEGSLTQTIKKIKDLGIEPKTNSKHKRRVWTVDNLRDLLRNPAFVGKREVNAKYKNQIQSELKPWQRYQVVPASWPKIIDDELFERVQNQLDEALKSERAKRQNSQSRTFWLTGVIRCPDCGKAFHGASSHGKYEVHRYYVHKTEKGSYTTTCQLKRINAAEIETAIEGHLNELLNRTGHLEKIEENLKKYQDSSGQYNLIEKEQLQKKLNGLENEINNLFELQNDAAQGLAKELFKERLERLAQNRQVLTQRLNVVELEISAAIDAKSATQQIKSKIFNFKKCWKKSTGSQKKQLIKNLIEKLIPTKEGLDLYYFTDSEKLPPLPVGSLAVKSSLIVGNGGGGGNRTRVRKRSMLRHYKLSL